MASVDAIRDGLAVLHEAFPTRPITTKTGKVFYGLFRETDDDAFLSACRTLARQRGRVFFPTPGEITALLAPRVAIDMDRLLEAIANQGQHTPTGFLFPRIERVRLVFGDEIGSAYAFAGAAKLYSENETSRDIARREFREYLDTASGPDITPWLVGNKLERLLPPPDRPPQQPRAIKGPKGPVWSHTGPVLKQIAARAESAQHPDPKSPGGTPQPAD